MSTRVKQTVHTPVTRETVCKTEVQVDKKPQPKPGTGNVSKGVPVLIDVPKIRPAHQHFSQENKDTSSRTGKLQNRSRTQSRPDAANSSTSGRNGTRLSSGRKHSVGSPVKTSRPCASKSPQDSTTYVVDINSDYNRDDKASNDMYDGLVEQDIAFINIPNYVESSKLHANENGRKVKQIIPEEILLEYHEKDPRNVYEISRHASHIAVIENVETFKKLRSLDLSCNSIKRIENLDSNTNLHVFQTMKAEFPESKFQEVGSNEHYNHDNCSVGALEKYEVGPDMIEIFEKHDLRELKLYGNELTAIENIERLKELSNLLLQHNRIKSIGKGLSRLSKLSTVRLDSNRLLKVVPAELVSCVNIRYLDLSNNMLDNIQAVNSLPNLEELFISNNRLRNLGDIGRCTKLQELDVSGNRLEDLTGMVKLTNLQILNAGRNRLRTLKSLGVKKKLEELDVSKNSLSSLRLFPDQFPSLEILNVSDNDLESLKEIKYLGHLKDLTELWLDGSLLSHDDSIQPYTSLEIQDMLPQLDMLDGISLRKQMTNPVIPVMRPMTAKGMISMRQAEIQLLSLSDDLSSFHKDMTNRFDTVRHVYQAWPAEDPTPRGESLSAAPPGGKRPQICQPSTGSNRNRRSRIFEAQVFAAEHFAEPETEVLPI